MTKQYQLDLEGFSLERFKRILESSELLPGRQILKEDLSERFEILESMGITDLKALMEPLKTKKRLQSFSQQSGLPEEYLVVLRREVNSYLPKPVNLGDIPGLDPEHVERLKAAGIKHTKHLFERAGSESERVELSRLAEVPGENLLEMVRLSDLARIGGVGPVFARILYEAGVDSPEALLNHSPEALLAKLRAVNEERGYTRSKISIKDVLYCIGKAKELTG